MDFHALLACLSSASCVVTQATGGLISGMLLFLVAAGLSLIFGTLKVTNFMHGSLYMLGAYFAYTLYNLTGSYASYIGTRVMEAHLHGTAHDEPAWLAHPRFAEEVTELLVRYLER